MLRPEEREHTGAAVWEDSVEGVNERFLGGGWGRAGGNIQSLLFAMVAFDVLTEFLPHDMSNAAKAQLRIHDYGCAAGDGTAVLEAMFPFSEVTGFDWSSGAVETARARWPTMRFKVGDVRDPQENADLIFTSHTLEHLEKPLEVIEGLRKRCRLLVVVVPPTDGTDATHFGAPSVREWAAKLDVVAHVEYPTFRANREDGGMLVEGNVLLVLKGALAA